MKLLEEVVVDKMEGRNTDEGPGWVRRRVRQDPTDLLWVRVQSGSTIALENVYCRQGLPQTIYPPCPEPRYGIIEYGIIEFYPHFFCRI